MPPLSTPYKGASSPLQGLRSWRYFGASVAPLALTKRRLAAQLDSGALRGDAASSLTCAYMAGAVLVGLVLNALLH